MTPKLKARLFVLLIFAACVAPVALSLFTYYVWKPQKLMNYGELLQAAPLPFADFKTLDTTSQVDKALQGKWILLLVDEPNCNEACERRLYAMRQTALAMEIKKDKLAQAWLLTSNAVPKKELLAQYPRTYVLQGGPEWGQRLPQPSAGRILLIDPNGVPILRYPEAPDAARMMKDLGRLLDVKRM